MTKATPAPQKPRRRNKTNPEGANQFKVDPRQSLFLEYYFDPKSATFSNGLQSAIMAGYSETTAIALTGKMPKWLQESAREFNRQKLLDKAEKNINEFLDLPSETQAMGPFGPLFHKVGRQKGKPIMVKNPSLLGLKGNMTQFVASKLGRKAYGEKAGGGLQLNVHVYGPEQLKRVAARIYNDESTGEAAPDRLLDSDKS